MDIHDLECRIGDLERFKKRYIEVVIATGVMMVVGFLILALLIDHCNNMTFL